ncbi:CDP-alcohol phosphatidyltransferase family protein [Alicyclobacillus fastidiosus]|uniref:CDP-alcohol phosphatidyltransferase family protein n=1 Tax=Alicyclobacillus fastidiosus TaxID=392011 RepID=A0ABY6ZHP4_9BACL|nr:CDP-alcohol phosphatidyltransferase family protein [Alicyclobacillus fastidiosus]WAH42418.1 CDP-alcohol phosphatidyltransferase family protein [Alicyclobacillus fastidiosus]GMA64238.1 membrane protein [Alicyclobacillus fastidiosus]
MLDTHARKYVQPVIRRTAREFSSLGLSANQVTWIAFVLGIASGILVYLGLPVVAVAALWVSGFLDAVDGSMAREQNRMSPWGTVMDVTFDRIVELGIIITLAIRFPQAQLLLLLLTAGIVFSMTVFLTVGALSEKKGMKSFYYQAGLAERTEGFILFSVMVLFPHWMLWSTGVFLFVEVFTGLQRMLEARRLLK